MARGRPSSYTEEIAGEIIDRITEGDYGGVAVADRVALLERIRNDLHNLAEAA